MCAPEWEIIRLTSQSIGARLSDGRVIDLQQAHVALRGKPSPHLRDATAFRLSAAYGHDLARELIRAREQAAT